MSQKHFDPSKDRHTEMAEQVISVITDADGWITTPELAAKAEEETSYSENYIRSKLYYMRTHLEGEGVETKKQTRKGVSGGDPAWHFRKEVSEQ